MNQEDLQTEEGVSRILPDTVVQAKMEAVKPVYLAGTVEGDVCCKSLLVIDPGGRVQGDVICEGTSKINKKQLCRKKRRPMQSICCARAP